MSQQKVPHKPHQTRYNVNPTPFTPAIPGPENYMTNQATNYAAAVAGHHTQQTHRNVHQAPPQQQEISKQQPHGGYQMRPNTQPQQQYRAVGNNQNNNGGRNAGGRPQGQQLTAAQTPQPTQMAVQSQHVPSSVQQVQAAQHQSYLMQSYAPAQQQPYAAQPAPVAQYIMPVPQYPPTPARFNQWHQNNNIFIASRSVQSLYPGPIPQIPSNMVMANPPMAQAIQPKVAAPSKERKNRIKIVHPDTGMEINVHAQTDTASIASNTADYDMSDTESSYTLTDSIHMHAGGNVDYRVTQPVIPIQPTDTPVVSAMADCPDKAPIQNIAKKRKAIEVKAPPPATPPQGKGTSDSEQVLQSSQSIDSTNYNKQGNNEIPSNVAAPDDLPTYEGVLDPIPVIESALSCDANPFEPKKYREPSYTEVEPSRIEVVPCPTPENNNVIMDSVIETSDTTHDFTSDNNKNIIASSPSSLSPPRDETDKSATTDETVLINSNIENNNTIKIEEESVSPIVEQAVEPEIVPEPSVESVETPVVEEQVESAPEEVPVVEEPVAPKAVTPVEDEIVKESPKPEPAEEPAAKVPIKKASSRSMEKSLITYEKDQWSPANTEGQKKYSMSQLMELNKSELVKQRPDLPKDIANLVFSTGKPTQSRSYPNQKNFALPSGMFPSFAMQGDRNFGINNYSNKRSSQQGGRSSQQGGKNGSRGGLPQRPSFKSQPQVDVKLNEAENAWKPRHLADVDDKTPEQRETEDLYKKFRSILNKITPENFSVLYGQIMQLKMDTPERLKGAIGIVFEKAISEPNYSRIYSELCSKMATIRIESSEPKKTTFKVLLLNQCQEEFEKHKQDSKGQVGKDKIIAEEQDEEKRKKLKEELEEENYKIRHRAIGTVRFIGELYKIDMLNDSIMKRCINLLLENGDEDSLECLCKLVTTVGKTLESKKSSLEDCFSKLEQIANGKIVLSNNQKISSRIRFAIKDLIDLRRSKWQPRRSDQNPKTMGQIQKEAEQEHRNIEILNSFQPDKRGNRDDRRGNQMQGKYNNKDRKDGEWITAGQKNSRQQNFTLDFKNLRTPVDSNPMQKLGPSNHFSEFIKTATNNRFQGLDDSQTLDMSSSDTYNSRYGGDSGYNRNPQRQNSRESSRNRPDINGPSRSFQPPNRQSSMNAAANTGTFAAMMGRRSQQQQPQTQAPQTPQPAPAPQAPFSETELPSDDDLVKINLTFEVVLSEYLSNQSFDNFIEFKKIQRAYRWVAIREAFSNALDWKQQKRNAVADLLYQTLSCKDNTLLTVAEVKLGIKHYFLNFEELIIDCLKIHEYTAEVLGPLLNGNFLSFRSLLECASPEFIQKSQLGDLLAATLKNLAEKYGEPRSREIWVASKVEVKQFLNLSEISVEDFIESKKLQYITEDVSTKLTNQREILSRLTDLMGTSDKIDTQSIRAWIDSSVENTESNEFIRTLTSAAIKYCIVPKPSGYRFDAETRFIQITDLLKVYMHPEREIEVLYAIQAYIKSLEFPQGLMQDICNSALENFVISREGFVSWKDDPTPSPEDAEGKGVCLKMLTSFFTTLADIGSDDSEEGEDD